MQDPEEPRKFSDKVKNFFYKKTTHLPKTGDERGQTSSSNNKSKKSRNSTPNKPASTPEGTSNNNHHHRTNTNAGSANTNNINQNNNAQMFPNATPNPVEDTKEWKELLGFLIVHKLDSVSKAMLDNHIDSMEVLIKCFLQDPKGREDLNRIISTGMARRLEQAVGLKPQSIVQEYNEDGKNKIIN